MSNVDSPREPGSQEAGAPLEAGQTEENLAPEPVEGEPAEAGRGEPEASQPAQEGAEEGSAAAAEEAAVEAAPPEAAPEPAPPPAAEETEAVKQEAAAPDAEPAATEEAEQEEAEPPAAKPPKTIGVPGMDWYIIHTYSGFENKVRESLRTRADAFGYGDRIGEILIPTEDVVEMRSGKKVTSKRLLYPGYVLIQLKMDDELWHVVKNTPRVTGFVGSGQTPAPLSADEVNQTLYRQTVSAEKPRPKMTFEKNDQVKIIDGPFTNFTGSVEEVNEDRNTVKVMVTIFGRGTPVELEYFQVEKEDL